MPTSPTRERLLEVVDASPSCVARHDETAWMALFASGAVVEDPVGSRPHRKGAGLRGTPPRDELGRFWNVFIAPNDIRFEVRADIVAGREVVRDVLIHTRLSTGLELTVPAHLLYELVEESGILRIARLAAHWELPRMSVQALRAGGRGLSTMTRLSMRMLRILGLSGTLGYSRGMFFGVGRRGRRVLDAFAAAVTARDEGSLASLFAGERAGIEHPAGRRDGEGDGPPAVASPESWLRRLPAGTRMAVDAVTPAGWTVSFRFAMRRRSLDEHGIGFLALDRRSGRVGAARFFVAAEPGGVASVDPGLAPR